MNVTLAWIDGYARGVSARPDTHVLVWKVVPQLSNDGRAYMSLLFAPLDDGQLLTWFEEGHDEPSLLRELG